MLVASAVICLALNMYHEARGESDKGQVAVAQVTMNRAQKNGTGICEEVFRHKQFSWANGKVKRIQHGWMLDDSLRPKEKEAYFKLLVFAYMMVDKDRVGHQNFQEVLNYHNKTVNPHWTKDMKKVAVIGNHIFYRKG